MYSVKSRNTAKHIESICLLNLEEVLYFVIEANYKDPTQYESGQLRKVLAKSLYSAIHSSESEKIPESVAFYLHQELSSVSNKPTALDMAFFSGILVKREKIIVCTAGDIRVHLIQGKQLVHKTRDHNLINDPMAKQPDSNLPKDFLVTVTTRAIGMGSLPPETYEWGVSGDYSVLVCTSQYHRYQEPKEYLSKSIDELLSKKQEALPPIFGTSWLLTEIKSTS
jgi:serine/threonine protein phosphatase PrpC